MKFRLYFSFSLCYTFLNYAARRPRTIIRRNQMDIRYSANQKDFKRYTTEETRNEFLIQNLYVANEVVSVYSHVDRMVTLGCMPTTEVVSIDKGLDVWANFGSTLR